ncbi:MAG: hypothetical protein KF684_09165 [Phycisphaeraceae bacterium]|nr:hypothetical protein [Phycisphaeraceae bacterium]
MNRPVMSNQTIERTPGASRRGSTIIVAVGVLAVLALVAVSYTVVVRNERRSALAYSTGIDLESAGRVVRDEIGAILTADLFGNKIVTSDVPREGNLAGGRIRVWPRMFEDGEYFDVPRTALGSFDTRTPDQQRFDPLNPNDEWVIAPRNSGALGPYFPSAPARDDAWLSNIEPYNPNAPLPTAGPQSFDWTTWGQISNIRDSYRHRRAGNNDTVGLWVRGDGRYADLAQFFLTQESALNESGDPGANLLYAQRTNGIDAFTGQRNGPRVGLSTTPGPGGAVQLATEVFGLQIHQLAEETSPVGDANAPALDAFDRRFWVDTDGDLRPDARWTIVDALDGLQGLRWVVAARIIDNSGLVNVNTALEFQDPNQLTTVGDGRTPADVDLYRLLSSANLAPDLRTDGYWSPPPPGFPEIVAAPGNRAARLYRLDPRDSVNWRTNPFNQHLMTQLGMDRFTEQYTPGPQTIPLPVELRRPGGSILFQTSDVFFGSGSSPQPFTTRLHRYLHNAAFGVSPLQSQTRQLTGYSLADEAAMRAYHAVNYDAITSKIEQRFDHGVLDGSADPDLGVGPMRVLERAADARQLTQDPSQFDRDRPTPFAIATDTRRHLTTVNGAGDFSPVPVLNQAQINRRPVFGQQFNTRVRFLDVPYVSPTPAATGLSSAQRDKARVLERAFESFAWALAPLAGHLPLMSPLDEDHTGWSLMRTTPQDRRSRYFYGGDAQGNRGPAWALSQQNGPVNGVDPAAAYAILRAASLALNLADATDDLEGDPPIPGRSLPTVARLYNIPHPRPYEIDPYGAGDTVRYAGLPARPQPDAVQRLGVGFSWGDLRDPDGTAADTRVAASNTDLLPPEYVGEPLNGVTLVGLDRQPFLREVSTVAIYADRLARLWPPGSPPTPLQLSTADQAINPAEIEERVGSIIAWEVGNPWPDAIDASEYRLALAVSESEYLTFQWGAAGLTSSIAPGGRVVFYAVQWEPGNEHAEDFMPLYEAQWRAEMELRIDGANLRRVNPADEPGLRDATITTVLTEPIPFWEWSTGSAVGLLMLDFDKIPGAGTVVLDRIAAGTSGAVPVRLASTYNLTPATLPGQRRTGVLTMAGTVHRRTETPNPGFPAWVIERATENAGVVTQPNDILSEWIVTTSGPGGLGPDPGDVPAAQGQRVAEVVTTLAEEEKGAITVANFPSFQLFVPNTELRYLSELHQLSAFTHMYVHDAPDDMGAKLGVNITQPAQTGPGSWRTISEQLGSDAEIFRNGQNATLGLNPYLGVLDPTRFVLAAGGAGAAPNQNLLGVLGPVLPGSTVPSGLPESLAIPLALRVFDAFEPLATPSWRDDSRLVQGRMNINTAAQKNLRMLPLLDPQDAIGPLQRQSVNALSDRRVPLIMEYRDRPIIGSFGRTPAEITGLLGADTSAFRYLSPNAEPDMFDAIGGGAPLARGFVSLGELAVLDEWETGPTVNASNPRNPGAAQPRGFLELGADAAALGANDTAVPSLDVRRESFSGSDLVVRPTPYNGGSLDQFKGVDDPEERLAIFRAVSNIATTRSDVFSAYFVVRGYAPGDIESIEVVPNPSDFQINTYLEALRPAYEARYLAVFDRSTVRVPTDRPRVLLFVRLPD